MIEQYRQSVPAWISSVISAEALIECIPVGYRDCGTFTAADTQGLEPEFIWTGYGRTVASCTTQIKVWN
jgi:hypothetical protein